MSQYDTKLEDRLRSDLGLEEEPQPATEAQQEEELFGFGEPEPQKPDLSQARSLLTEPHPAGFGEVLVTDVWAAPAPRAEKKDESKPFDSAQDKALDFARKKLFGFAQGESPGSAKDRPFDPTSDRPFDPTSDRPFDPTSDRPFDPAKDRPFGSAPDRPFDSAKDRPFDPAKDRLFDPAKDRLFDSAKDRLFDSAKDRLFDSAKDRPFGSAKDRPFGSAQDRPFGSAQDRPFGSAQDRPPDRQREWETRQELRQLGLLRERALVSYDARFEQYWRQTKEAIAAAPSAIVDPYTEFAAEFADARTDEMGDDRRISREYGREGDSLLNLGRAYVAIGRHKGARAVLEAAAKAEPQHPEIWYNLGLVRLFGRANAAARQALEKALDQAPGDFRAELALAVACYHLKDYAAAEGHFRRLAGGSGLRATARAMLACSHRMQGHWDNARIELSFLKSAKPGDWPALVQQCLDCVERGEQKREGLLRAKRRAGQMWRALAATAGGGVWLAYSLTENLFREKAQWAVVPLFVLALLLVRSLKGFSGKELSGEFGNAEQGIPCWQANTWIKPKQSEF